MSATLPEQAAEYAADVIVMMPNNDAATNRAADGIERALRRAFMAGALAALTDPRPRETLLAEVIGYGRAIGTAAERARG